MDTTEGTGGAGFYQDYYSQNEIAVSGAGQDVSMNTPGAAVISTIKSGGNTFKSLINQTYEGKSFVGNNVNSAHHRARRLGAAEPAVLGEPRRPGRPDRQGQALVLRGVQPLPHQQGRSRACDPNIATDLGIFNNFTTKETWKLSLEGHPDRLLPVGEEAEAAARPVGHASARDSTLAQTSPSWMYNGKWERVWSNRLFTELNIGNFGYVFPEQPSVDYTTNPPRHDLATGVDSGAGFAQGGTGGPFDFEREKPQVYGNATYYLPTKNAGSHDLKIGFEWIDDQSDFANIGTSGPLLYLDYNGAAG